MKVSDNFFEVFYDEMTEGQKQHMSNKIYKETGLYPQKLYAAKLKPSREELVYKRGDKLTHKGSGRTFTLSTVMVGGDRYLFAINTRTGGAYSRGVRVPDGALMPEAVSQALSYQLADFTMGI